MPANFGSNPKLQLNSSSHPRRRPPTSTPLTPSSRDTPSVNRARPRPPPDRRSRRPLPRCRPSATEAPASPARPPAPPACARHRDDTPPTTTTTPSPSTSPSECVPLPSTPSPSPAAANWPPAAPRDPRRHLWTQPPANTTQLGFWLAAAAVPFSVVVYNLAQPGKDGEAPWLTQKIHSYHAALQSDWAERSALHTKAIEQAGFDRALFLHAETNRDVDVRFPECVPPLQCPPSQIATPP